MKRTIKNVKEFIEITRFSPTLKSFNEKFKEISKLKSYKIRLLIK